MRDFDFDSGLGNNSGFDRSCLGFGRVDFDYMDLDCNRDGTGCGS